MIFRTASFVILLATALLSQRVPSAHGDNSPPRPSRVQDSLAIVVNLSNPVNDMTFAELRNVFLGERTHWPNGRRITLVMMEPGLPERDAVLREVYRMSEADFRRHFLQGLLTGEVLVSPKTLATPVGVRKFVFNVPGSIGYLRPADVDPSVKVVRIDGHLPGEADYELHLPERTEQ